MAYNRLGQAAGGVVGAGGPALGTGGHVDTAGQNHNRLAQVVVTEQAGKDFKMLSSQQLVRVIDRTMCLARDFADPNKNEVPMDYLRVFIGNALVSEKAD